MKTWSQVVRQALTMAGAQMIAGEHDNNMPYCYIYGGNGELLDEKRIKQLVKTYKLHFNQLFKSTGTTVEDLIRHCSGKYGFDCSGFLCFVTGAPHDMNSGSLINSCSLIVPPASGVAGSVLWKDGHVALDIGTGKCMEFVNEYQDVEINDISKRGFTRSGQLPWVDYRGASNM